MSDDPNDLVTAHEAATLAGVEPEQLQTMVDDGLLSPAEGSGDGAKFRRNEVLAVRKVGG